MIRPRGHMGLEALTSLVGTSASGPESVLGGGGGGELHGRRWSTCAVCRVRLVVCLTTTTRGDMNNSILHGPVHNFCSLRNF